MTDPVLIARIDALTFAVQHMAMQIGARLNREQLAARMGIHRNTLTKKIAQPGFPKPGRDGKWLLEEVIEWEKYHQER